MFTIYHNNRCSKSREALAQLEQQAQPIEVIHYLNTPLSHEQIVQLLNKLGFESVRQLLRTKEDAYQNLDLANPALTEAELIAAVIAHPILIERPIVIRGEKAIIARPPSSMLEWLQRVE